MTATRTTEEGTHSADGPRADDVEAWLVAWLRSTEQDHHSRRDEDGLEQAWYGTGYTGWGMQTCLQYLAAAGAVATHSSDPSMRRWARSGALAALRYIIATHVTGFRDAEDGRRWGRTWISVLGLERAGWVIDELEADLEPRYRDGLHRLLIDEADWQCDHHVRGGIGGIRGSRWEADGMNRPESNIWCGAHLWRTAERFPQHPRAATWRAAATRFLVNGVSVPGDAHCETVVDGVTVRDVHAGANFFDSFALDHHGYLNIGYMVICASNAAFALLDLRSQGREVPEALLWHQRDLWDRLRRFVASDGRLLRIGGDTRVRYAYCQEYLLPVLLMAREEFRDPDADQLIEGLLRIVEREHAEAGDGSLYGRRLNGLGRTRPYYRARLETDRACALGIWWHHHQTRTAHRETGPGPHAGSSGLSPVPGGIGSEAGTTSEWGDPEHGAALVRGPRRTASVSWRAASRTQILALPSDRSDLAEWAMNLSPVLRFEGEGPSGSPTESPNQQRQVVGYTLDRFPGGFISAGRIEEGRALAIAEGWHREDPVADSWIAVAALPDDATVIGLHLSRARDLRPPLLAAHGLNLLLPHDVHTLQERQTDRLSPGHLRIDGRLDVLADQELSVTPVPATEGTGLRSIGVQQIRAGARHGTYWAGAGETILDCAWLVRVRGADDPAPVLEHSHDADGHHQVTVTVPSGRWRLEFDPDQDTPATWGESPGRVRLTAVDASAIAERRER